MHKLDPIEEAVDLSVKEESERELSTYEGL